MNNILDVNAANFQQIIAEVSKEKLVALQFHSPQSPECQEQNMMLEKLAASYPEHLVIAKLNCDTEQALASQLAQQVGLQAIPSILVLKDGAPIDMIAGPQPEQALMASFAQHLPKAEDLLIKDAQQLLAQGNLSEAYTKAKQAYDLDKESAKVKLILADICLNIQKIDDAAALIDTINLIDQDAYYNNIKAKIELALEAKDSPEIRALEESVNANPNELELKVKLSVQYDQAGRKEEALQMLFTVLQTELGFGDARKMYLDVIATLPDGDELAAKYRRKLYSILY